MENDHCNYSVTFSLQAEKEVALASAATAGAYYNDDERDTYSDIDEAPQEQTKGSSAKTGKRHMDGDTPANQIVSVKRAKSDKSLT